MIHRAVAWGHVRDRSGLWLWALFGLMCLRLLAVDLFPTVTNDSLAYIDHSDALLDVGAVQAGYRQFGYPAFLAAIDGIAWVVRIEPLLLTVVAQRALLVLAMAYAVWLWRWWALPLVFVLTTPTLVAYHNFILTEALGLPVAVLYGCVVAHVLRVADRSSVPKLLVTSLGATYLLLVAIRFHFLVLGVPIVVVAYVLFRRGGDHRRWGIILVAGVTAAGLVMTVAMSIENQREFGVFSPSARGERSQFWAVWTDVFRDPENAANPTLADLYSQGDPYVFMAAIDFGTSTYPAQRRAYADAIDSLLEESGSSVAQHRLASTIGVLWGGRIDDLAALVRAMASVSPDEIDALIAPNRFARDNGVGAMFDEYNDGQVVEPVVVSPLAPTRAGAYFVPVVRIALLGALTVLIGGLFVPAARTVAVTGLATAALDAAVIGYAMLANVRFILVPNVFVITVAIGALAAVAGSRRPGAATVRQLDALRR